MAARGHCLLRRWLRRGRLVLAQDRDERDERVGLRVRACARVCVCMCVCVRAGYAEKELRVLCRSQESAAEGTTPPLIHVFSTNLS